MLKILLTKHEQNFVNLSQKCNLLDFFWNFQNKIMNISEMSGRILGGFWGDFGRILGRILLGFVAGFLNVTIVAK